MEYPHSKIHWLSLLDPRWTIQHQPAFLWAYIALRGIAAFLAWAPFLLRCYAVTEDRFYWLCAGTTFTALYPVYRE
jgi:hypothetical protein